jgi:ferredoxin-NADP reductase
MFTRHPQDVFDPIYYLTGPAVMVTTMRTVLSSVGVDSDDLKTEEFSGY